MKGHDALIEMRRGGQVPDIVWLETDPDRLNTWASWSDESPRHAYVWIEPHEIPALMDLYFLVGLCVHVEGGSASRVQEAAEACKTAGAKRVIAATFNAAGKRELISDTAGYVQ